MSDHDLRRMLDAREREQEARRRHQGRHATKIFMGLLAIVGVWGLVVVKMNEAAPLPPAPATPVSPTELPAVLQQSDSSKAAQMPGVFAEDPAKPADPGALPGLKLDKEDVKFGVELMNFLQPPSNSKPAETAK